MTDILRLPFSLLNRVIWRVANAFGDERAREVERFLKFAIVGIVGAIVDFTILNVLEHTVLVPQEPNPTLQVALATGIAFCTAVLSNFIWNRYWTFPDSRSHSLGRQLFQFAAVSVVGLVFRLIFVGVSFHFFGEVGSNLIHSISPLSVIDDTSLNQIGSNVAQAISIVIVLFWNFFANRYWTYNDVK